MFFSNIPPPSSWTFCSNLSYPLLSPIHVTGTAEGIHWAKHCGAAVPSLHQEKGSSKPGMVSIILSLGRQDIGLHSETYLKKKKDHYRFFHLHSILRQNWAAKIWKVREQTKKPEAKSNQNRGQKREESRK
jgi:hypothetical protein